MYQKILIATDLHDMEKSAAIQRSEQFMGEKYLIHVVEQFYDCGAPPYTFDTSEIQQLALDEAKKQIHSLATKIGIPEERCFVSIGSAKERILKAAAKIEADLIILGSHSQGGLSELLLGSTANGVLHGARCDVLAVRSR